jgi:ABC-type uncharacterized transport system auxiliary subunit
MKRTQANGKRPPRGVIARMLHLPSPLPSSLVRLLSCALCALLLSGCLHSLYPKSAPPQYYRIDYPFQPAKCARPFPATVRLSTFTGSAPYDREQMIATSPDLQVQFSSHYQWIAPPADMVANDLMRDLSIGKVFETVAPAGGSMPAAYGMSGQIYRFDLEKSGASSSALLDLEITLWREKPRTLIFRRHFHYQSPPLTSDGPGEFAAAMSQLVARLSMDLRNDLCALRPDSLHPAGD